MNGFLFWQEKVELAERVKHAASAFERKYGLTPTVAFANPKLLGDHETIIDGITVKPMRNVSTICLWIGVEQAAQELEQHSRDLVSRVMLAVGRL